MNQKFSWQFILIAVLAVIALYYLYELATNGSIALWIILGGLLIFLL